MARKKRRKSVPKDKRQDYLKNICQVLKDLEEWEGQDSLEKFLLYIDPVDSFQEIYSTEGQKHNGKKI